jgi:hypothetical protein
MSLMMVRHYLNQHMRRSTISCWLGVAFAVVSIVVGEYPMLQRVALVITVVCFANNIYHNFTARCPRCRTRLLLCVAINGLLLKIPSWFNSCPSCGMSFDTQLDATQRSNQALEPTASRSDV